MSMIDPIQIRVPMTCPSEHRAYRFIPYDLDDVTHVESFSVTPHRSSNVISMSLMHIATSLTESGMILSRSNWPCAKRVLFR